MAIPLTLQDVLEEAIRKEIASRCLYLDLSQKMNAPAATDALRELAREEQNHQDLLERYRRGELKQGALSKGQTVDYKIAEHLAQPEVSPDMKLEDVFLLAADREKSAHDLYLSLARIHPPGEVKGLFEKLAAQELGHKHKVEFLYTEVAFPQTDGG